MYTKLFKINNVDFSATDQLLTTNSLLLTYLNEKWNKLGQCNASATYNSKKPIIHLDRRLCIII